MISKHNGLTLAVDYRYSQVVMEGKVKSSQSLLYGVAAQTGVKPKHIEILRCEVLPPDYDFVLVPIAPKEVIYSVVWRIKPQHRYLSAKLTGLPPKYVLW